MTEFNEKQIVQDVQYEFPYHWIKIPNTFDGREYFGYLSLCINKIDPSASRSIRILDAGCGDGRFIRYLHEHDYRNVDGVDYSKKAIQFAKVFLPKTSFSVMDLSCLEKSEIEYDYIFFIETLEHIIPSQIPDVLRGLSNLLKSDGKLIVSVPSLYGGAPLPGGKHYQHFTVTSLKQALSPYFDIVSMTGQDLSHKPLFNFIYRFTDNRFWQIYYLRDCLNGLWERWYNQCEPTKGRRLIAVCKKST